MSILVWFEIRVVPHSYSSMGGREGGVSMFATERGHGSSVGGSRAGGYDFEGHTLPRHARKKHVNCRARASVDRGG